MYTATVEKVVLNFKLPAGTSRGILKSKNSWIVRLSDSNNPGKVGIGEASIIENLSPEWSDQYETKLHECIEKIDSHVQTKFVHLKSFPSIRFAFEAAYQNLVQSEKDIYFPSEFTQGKESIKINGLIWMGAKDQMLEQIKDKLENGFDCLKLKIGAIDFDAELDLLKFIRSKFSKDSVEIRVDANGAFAASEALDKLNKLAQHDIHSVEQPIQPKQWESMAELCKNTPLPIALDEELIGIKEIDSKLLMLSSIKPQYIILKPSFTGGFEASDEWIEIAASYGIKWWITSALESNVGLNAIAQYAYTKNNPMPQGLGTGLLFTNNIESPLQLKGDQLFYNI